uniref:Activated leukocyte cell adhesion molecule b n=1 Tax=Oryzias latipes TaxID=8090 RepID=A0A3P9J999_ORYLA
MCFLCFFVPHKQMKTVPLLSSFAVKCMPSVRGLFGETIEIPCKPFIQTENTMMIKWKYEKRDGSPQDLIVKSKDQDPLMTVPDAFKHRVSMAANSSLLLSGARLTDQGTFTCMVVTSANIFEHQIKLEVLKSPEGLEIFDKAEELEIGKLTKLGVCTAKNANPAADIMWLKNNQALVDDGKGVHASILITDQIRPHAFVQFLTAELVLFPTDSPETVELLVTPQDPLVEGDNMTLKCVADGNPAPTSFNFHLKGETIKVENKNAFTITNVTRDASGEYKCSLIDDRGLEASKNVTVNYLDINLRPSGRIEKLAGEALEVTLQIYSSAAHSVSWKKDNRILENEPKFPKIAYSDSGVYECEVALGPLSRKASFELVVQGAPVISSLSKHSSDDGKYKVLTCEAEGFPKPAVTWNINGTLITESPFSNGKIIQKFAVVPSENLTVQCTVSNKFGSDSKSIDVSHFFVMVTDTHVSRDQTKLVVGVVLGLLVATVLIGLAYWLYLKKSK